MLPTTWAAKPMLPTMIQTQFSKCLSLKTIYSHKTAPSHDACSGVNRIVSFGFNSAFCPVSAANNISGYVRAMPMLKVIKFLIVTAIICVWNNQLLYINIIQGFTYIIKILLNLWRKLTCAAYDLNLCALTICCMTTWFVLRLETKATSNRNQLRMITLELMCGTDMSSVSIRVSKHFN